MDAQPSPLEQNVLKRPTLCRLCGQEFQGGSLSTAAIIGENPQAKIQQVQALISPLMKHLQKKHPESLQWAQMMGGEFGGLLSLNFFQCDEPAIERSRDETRWKISQITRRVAITDERIKERLRQAALDDIREQMGGDHDEQEIDALVSNFMQSAMAGRIIATMQQMRDVLQEKDRYAAPRMPAPAAKTPENGAQTAPQS